MSFVKRLEFGNYTLTFGNKKVLLDLFDEVVMPSFYEMKYVRKIGDHSEFFFLDTELIVLDDKAENPVLGITGRIVKNTKLKRDQIFRDGSLVDDKDEMESAPSSTFLLILNSHRLILTKEVPGAPTIQNFQHTSQYCLSNAYAEYISKQRDEADEAREQNPKLERVTKKKLMEDTPPPHLRITPLADKESLDKFIGRFKTINKLSIKLLPTNREEIDNDDFWASMDQSRVSMGKDSVVKVDFTSHTTGLDNKQVLDKTVTATALGNSAVDIKGIDAHGDALKGNQDSFSLSVDVEELPKEVKKSARTQYRKFNDLIQAGAITMPNIANKTIDNIKKLFGRF
ncbi:Uncharacterised protein [Plesiomonas shigelloides]|uniref:hypothetical protein n=1 Tax=Plesiomonas shigelloides TaxID=703 RepID=UPI0007EE131D|nr:hypothetical protein [Plesiomonas shigelloides]SBT60170.1 Uncharacterised protein [Plesiomonas shigelloides]